MIFLKIKQSIYNFFIDSRKKKLAVKHRKTYISPMPTIKEIKDWLKSIKKDRSWLAEQCGVSVNTVYYWFSVNGKIPIGKLLQIKELMEDKTDDLTVQHGDIFEITPSGIKALALVWTEDDWKKLVQAAASRGMTPEEYAKRAIFDKLDD